MFNFYYANTGLASPAFFFSRVDPECAISSQVELKDTSGIAYAGCFEARRREKLHHLMTMFVFMWHRYYENQTKIRHFPFWMRQQTTDI